MWASIPTCSKFIRFYEECGLWCNYKKDWVDTYTTGYLGLCDDCPNNTSKKSMSLKDRCIRIRQIDEVQIRLSNERHELYYDGLTVEQHNKLWDMVMADGKPHSL